MIKLSSNAISSMISQVNGKGERHIVEVFNVKRKEQSFRFDLKDATTTIKGALFPLTPQLDLLKVCSRINNQDRYLIKITEFQVHSKGTKVMIQIHNFTPLTQSSLQNQKTVKLEQSSKTAVKKEYKQQETPFFKTEKKQPPNTSNRNNYSAIQRSEPSYGRQQRYQQEQELYDEEKLKQFQKISDLYIDFQGRWEIVVRVIDKSYRQFNNKSNKLTKIFSMVLVDRTGFKIEGVMFGDDAKDYHQLIRVNQVYRISRGQVREQNFNQAKPRDFSKYNIIFTKNSYFVPVKDIPSIPKFVDPDPTLHEIISQGNLDKTYTVAAILLDIGEQRWIQKQSRSIFKKNLVVGDPETKRSVEVVIWNKDMNINPSWVDKTILLKYFKLHSYRDVLSFSSVFKSQITLKQGHRFNKYEGTYGKQSYEPIGGEEKVEQGKDKHIRTIKDLQLQLQYNSGQVVYSDLEVWLTHMSFKGKWHYEACNNPKCKKAAQSHNKCMFCGHTNEHVQSRYILPIELGDSTGSIWVTAFDQFSNEIFKGYAIHELTKLDEAQLKQVAQCRLYVEYKVRISSKKDGEGNVKHSIVGKVTQTNIERSSVNNLQKIKKALF